MNRMKSGVAATVLGMSLVCVCVCVDAGQWRYPAGCRS